MLNRRLFAEAQIARYALVATVVFDTLTGVLIIGQALLLSQVINRVFLLEASLDGVSTQLQALAVVIAARALNNVLVVISAAQVAISVKTNLRQRLIAHIFKLGPAFSQTERSGELTTTVTDGIDALEPYYRDYLPALFTAILVPLMILLVVFPIDLLTFVVLLVTAPLIPIFMVLIGKAAGILAERQYAELGRMSAHFLDVMQGLTTLKLFNRSKRQLQTIAEVTDRFRLATLKVLRVAFLSAFTLELLSTISIALVAVEIGLRLLNGGIAFEFAIFLLIIAPEFYLPLRALGTKFHAGQDGVAAAQRIFSVLDEPLPPQTLDPAGIPDRFALRFDTVSYSYQGGNRPAVKGISVTVSPGEKVAIVGESGSGKSTIANLILRFIEPTAGRIRVDDTLLNTIAPDLWRDQIAWVPQTPYLFNTTVAENIRLGNPEASPHEVIEAAQVAEAHMFIQQLPDGYDTVCGERATRLSGGQAKRIALARAFLKNAPLLILDEAMAFLDPDTEARIDNALDRLFQGKTVIVIAHRLNTIRRADRILVMENGRIVESGSHDDLLANEGVYRHLADAFWDGDV